MSGYTYCGTVPMSVHIVDSKEHEDTFGNDNTRLRPRSKKPSSPANQGRWRAPAASLVQALRRVRGPARC